VKAKQLDPDKLRLPKPPYPVNRCEPLLPWRCPKPSEEDSNAPARVQAILESPSYRRADADLDSLGRDSMRGVRLWIDYFKPELLFEEPAFAIQPWSSELRGYAKQLLHNVGWIC
jgi:hypothetical protein